MVIVPVIALLLSQFSFNMSAMMAAPCMICNRADVKKELKLNKQQNKTVDDAFKAVNKAMQDSQKTMSFSAITTAMDEGNAKIWEALDDTQDQRLRELILQMKGASALTEDDTIKALSITDEQLTKLKDLKTKVSQDWLAAAQGGISGQKKSKGILEQYEKDAVAILTPEQSTKYTAMLGKIVKNLRTNMPPF